MNALFYGRIMSNTGKSNINYLSRIAAIILGLPWIEILTDAWKLARKIVRGLTNEGMYEVLDYETTLELIDKKGEKARLRKRKTVRYLQDNIIASQDFAWGDGKFLVNYQVTPGEPVDRYRLDNKTIILISLKGIKNKGDVDEFNIGWEIHKGFLKDYCWWTTEVSHRFKRAKVNVIFPESRPPLKVLLVEHNIKRTKPIENNKIKQLPNGRWKVTWESDNPRLHERYIIKWKW